MNKRRQPRGFTLIEIMFSVAMFAIVGAVLMGSFTLLHRTAREVGEAGTVEHEQMRCLQAVAGDLRGADRYAYDPVVPRLTLWRGDAVVVYEAVAGGLVRVEAGARKRMGRSVISLAVMPSQGTPGLVTLQAGNATLDVALRNGGKP